MTVLRSVALASFVLPVASLASLALGACAERDASPGTETATGTPAEGTSTGSTAGDPQGAHADGCAAGATSNAEGGYCLVLPPDARIASTNAASASRETSGERRYEYASPAGTLVVVVKTARSVDGDVAWASAKQSLVDQAASLSGVSRAAGDTVSATWKELDGRRIAARALRREGTLVECRATSTTAPLLQACETLRLL
jgi:hypothetical protein